eukprot:CAMPEP_0115500066 /NCGR_PEP_ID=MMETSP0271-20121206/67673_1 /TAXON_ID=71861 /ORGANISM="Scrippsiella trochoidea, Strain CCMP3099" /LENGTH=81 /DNA_ID=CAMNT_0002928923 /DNA_START=192 /DNA_END=437 /DNA_ORIENTATION=+
MACAIVVARVLRILICILRVLLGSSLHVRGATLAPGAVTTIDVSQVLARVPGVVVDPIVARPPVARRRAQSRTTRQMRAQH